MSTRRPTDDMPSRTWHAAALLVRTRPQELSDCVARLECLAGVEVHHSDPATGRIIVVVESDSLESQMQLHWRVNAVPGVLLADLVYARRDEETPGETETGGESHLQERSAR